MLGKNHLAFCRETCWEKQPSYFCLLDESTCLNVCTLNWIIKLYNQTCASTSKRLQEAKILWSFIKRQTSGTSSDNEWQRVVQRVITNDSEWYNEWQRVVQRVTTNDNEWYNEWQRVTTGGMEWREVTTSDNFGQTSFFQIIWCWYEPFFISLRQRLLQTVVIDVFKIYVNLSKSTIVVFLKLSTSYLLFIIKMCFFFFDEKQMFCFVLQKDSHS